MPKADWHQGITITPSLWMWFLLSGVLGQDWTAPNAPHPISLIQMLLVLRVADIAKVLEF